MLDFRGEDFLNAFKIDLLFILVFFIPIVGNAELVGGHERQRLSLIFLEQLNSYVNSHPVTINLEQFPVTLNDVPESQTAIALFEVLVEEGLLVKSMSASEIGQNNLLFTQTLSYERSANSEVKDFIVGQISVEQITRLTWLVDKTEPETTYEVHFTWRFKQPAPWVWAPVLSSNEGLNFLKTAMSTSKASSAQFIWQNDRWQLLNSPQFEPTGH